MHSGRYNRPVVGGPGGSTTLKKFSISDRDILNKRIKTNPRYDGVTSRTNSGFNTQRRQELEQEIRRYYKVRNDEVFRRISLADLVQLMVAHAEDMAAGSGGGGAEDGEEGKEENGEEDMPLKYRDELRKVVHGMDNLEVGGGDASRPYTLVDVRQPGEFKTSHLATAVCHPAARLSRAVGWECPALLTAKNREAAIIVLYDNCEEAAGEAVATLQHRGYTNAFMLSGGFNLARDKFGSPLVSANPATSLHPQVATTLATQLAATILPPLSMADAAEWWAAASGDPINAPQPPPVPSTGHHSSRAESKVRPWR